MGTNRSHIDYYNNFISYVKIIANSDEKNLVDTPIIKDIYNNYLNEYSVGKNNSLLAEMIITTALFENRQYILNNDERNRINTMIYEAYIKPMVTKYRHGDMEIVNKLFNLMHEHIKCIVGYNMLYFKSNDLNSVDFGISM